MENEKQIVESVFEFAVSAKNLNLGHYHCKGLPNEIEVMADADYFAAHRAASSICISNVSGRINMRHSFCKEPVSLITLGILWCLYVVEQKYRRDNCLADLNAFIAMKKFYPSFNLLETFGLWVKDLKNNPGMYTEKRIEELIHNFEIIKSK
jgi:hypothetical protein